MMELKILASTKVGHEMTREEALKFSGMAAGICYLPDTVETLLAEPEEKTVKRYTGNLTSMHHSVFGHAVFNLLLVDVPKILAMVLNNEKAYTTSEKSARYTKMKPSGRERALYERWLGIFQAEIKRKFGFDEKRGLKLAQENARYMISVFTPATTMLYSVNFEQLNYLVGWMKKYQREHQEEGFKKKLGEVFAEFVDQVTRERLVVEKLNSSKKGWSLSLFAERERDEEFGENYSINYLASFAELAQAQRHRTLSYEMSILKNPSFYVPPLIRRNQWLVKEWNRDLASLAEFYPQGMLIKVNERGTLENFKKKCQERLCGTAQLEIANQTRTTLNQYLFELQNSGKTALYEELLPYADKSRCQFLPGWQCDRPCAFGPKESIRRRI